MWSLKKVFLVKKSGFSLLWYPSNTYLQEAKFKLLPQPYSLGTSHIYHNEIKHFCVLSMSLTRILARSLGGMIVTCINVTDAKLL